MAKLILKIAFKTLKVIFTVLVIVALIVVISQRVTNNKLRLFGYGVYTVISESMLPEYEVGDMFLANEVKEEDDIKVGDDIVYIGEVDSYKDKVITHRVIRIEPDKSIVTKGINNVKVTAKFVVLSLFSKLMNDNVLFYIIIFVPFTLLIFLDTKDLFSDKKDKKKENSNEEKIENKPQEQPIPVQTANVVTETKVEPVNNNIEENKEVKEENIESKE